MAKEVSKSTEAKTEVEADKQNERCGIIMPISSLDGCDEGHWANVLAILSDAIRIADYEPNLVSAADDIGVIQKRIVQNIYQNPIVVCDVSGKNPNVMLELGMRLAFDKPVIIVKDDKTSYSFDTSPIEHLSYPRDLRYHTIVEFKDSLARKIKATVAASQKGDHTTFLGHFGEFQVAKIDTKEVSADDLILSQIQEIRDEIRIISNKQNTEQRAGQHNASGSTIERVRAEKYAVSIVGARVSDGQTQIQKSEIDDMISHVAYTMQRSNPNFGSNARREIAEKAVMAALTKSGITDVLI